MASDGKFLPAPVEKMLSDLTSQDFPFIWNFQNDGYAVQMNISWKYQDQRTRPVRNLHSKPPSMIRRDRERISAFLARKNETSNEENISLSPNGRSGTTDSDVSTFPCSISQISKNKNSFGTQTTLDQVKINSSVAETQTERREVKECATLCNIVPEKLNTSVQTNPNDMDCNSNSHESKAESNNATNTITEPQREGTRGKRNSLPEIERIVRRKLDGFGQEKCLVKFKRQPPTKNRWVYTSDLEEEHQQDWQFAPGLEKTIKIHELNQASSANGNVLVLPHRYGGTIAITELRAIDKCTGGGPTIFHITTVNGTRDTVYKEDIPSDQIHRLYKLPKSPGFNERIIKMGPF